jgi:TonB-dependent starch-binding outer membrane protein SusC
MLTCVPTLQLKLSFADVFCLIFCLLISGLPVSLSGQDLKDDPAENRNHGDLVFYSRETSSVILLTEKDFNKGNITNVWQLIQGRVPGLYISMDGGAPGAKGAASMRTVMGPPLVVLDELPLDVNFAGGMRDALNFLNPANIESVMILHDAAASSLYGIRGGNGVIVITTKKAKANTPFSVRYASDLSLAQPGRKVDVLDASSFRNLILNRYADLPQLTDKLGENNTNWQDEIFSHSFSHNHDFSATGTMATIPWRASFHYHDHGGVLNTDQLGRYGGRFNMQPSFLDDHLRISLNIHASQMENTIAPRRAIGEAIGFDPTQPVKVEGNKYGGYFFWGDNEGRPRMLARPNPVAMLQQTNDFAKTQIMDFKASADYSLQFYPAITLGFSSFRQSMKTRRDHRVSDHAAWQYWRGGLVEVIDDVFVNNLLEARASFNKTFPQIFSHLDVHTAWSTQEFRNDNHVFSSNIDNNLAGIPYGVTQDFKGMIQNSMHSFSAGIRYAFKNLYHFSYNYRNDKTSLFDPDSGNPVYHSMGLSWNMHNEAFWPENSLVSRFKIKAAAGQSGNMNLPIYQDVFGLDLQPEKFETYNGGIEFGLNKDRFYGNVNFYTMDQTGVFLTVPVPTGNGMRNMLVNAGNINYRGGEFTLNIALVSREKTSWEVGSHLSLRKSEVKELSSPQINSLSWESFYGGRYLYVLQKGYSPKSFYVYQSVYSSQGYPLGYLAGSDPVPYKTPFPVYHAGISSHLRHGNWHCSLAGSLTMRNYVYNNTASAYGHFGQLYYVNAENNVTSEAIKLNLEKPLFLSDYFVQDASFFRMDYLSLAYNFKHFRHMGLSVHATVQNAFVLTRYPGPEPEVPSGIDFNPYARPRIFSLGVKLEI